MRPRILLLTCVSACRANPLRERLSPPSGSVRRAAFCAQPRSRERSRPRAQGGPQAAIATPADTTRGAPEWLGAARADPAPRSRRPLGQPRVQLRLRAVRIGPLSRIAQARDAAVLLRNERRPHGGFVDGAS